MAFAIGGLSYTQGSGKGARLWSYLTTGDTLATVRAVSYFDDSGRGATRFKVGDIILMNCSDGFGMNVVATVVLSTGVITLSAENVTSA